MQYKSKNKKNKNIPKPLKKKKIKSTGAMGENFSVKSLISKFITNIFENNFFDADKTLQSIVEVKTTDRIKEATKTAKNKAKGGKPDFLDEDDDCDTDESTKTASKDKKGKLSKAENKKQYKGEKNDNR